MSQQCGPFRGHNFMFQILVEGILKLREVRIWNKSNALKAILLIDKFSGSLDLACCDCDFTSCSDGRTIVNDGVRNFSCAE